MEKFIEKRWSLSVLDKGSVSLELYQPDEVKAVVTLAHGAGTNMDHAFLKQLAGALAKSGVAVIRFNFLYSEHKRKMPDRFPTAAAVIRAVIQEAVSMFPTKAVFCSGKSFGGRMSSMTLADEHAPSVKGIIFYGFPLHPAGSPSVDRAEHLAKVKVPMLFLQGTRDALATVDLIRKVTSGLPAATLLELEGADHSFKGGKQSGVSDLARLTMDFINKHT